MPCHAQLVLPGVLGRLLQPTFPLYTVSSQSSQPIRTVGKKSNRLFSMIIYIDNIFICFDLINLYATQKNLMSARTHKIQALALRIFRT